MECVIQLSKSHVRFVCMYTWMCVYLYIYTRVCIRLCEYVRSVCVLFVSHGSEKGTTRVSINCCNCIRLAAGNTCTF